MHSWTFSQVPRNRLAGPLHSAGAGKLHEAQGTESRFAVATWAWAADPGVITHPLTGLRRRMETWSHQEGVRAAALGWLGVYGSFGLEPQLLQAVLLGRAKERQLDSAQLLSQTQLSCS